MHHHRHDELSAHQRGDSSYTHRARAAGGRTLAIAVGLTLGFAAIEFVAGLWSGSLALLADAVSLPPGRPKEGAVPLGGTARSAREQMSPLGGTARSAKGAP